MELEQMPQTGPGLCGSDREVFERVWRRVTATGGAESPIEVVPAVECQPATPLQPARVSAPVASTPVQAAPAVPQPARVEPSPAPRRAEVQPVFCLGPSSAGHGEELQRFIEFELTDAKTYAALSRRSRGQVARTFAAMATDEMRHAKRLSTAYFLISGVRYFPVEQSAAQLEGAYMSTLRSRFQAEQQGEAAYRAAAGRTKDACLRDLYLELAGDENSHGWLVRGILEEL